MIQNKTLYLLLIFLFTSCTPTSTFVKEQVVGIYLYESKIGNIKIELLPDNTFDYKSEIPFNEKISFGNWYLENNKLVLKSHNSLKNNQIEFTKEKVEKNGFIQVFDKDSIPIMNALVIINDDFKNTYYTNYDGKVKFTEVYQSDLKKVEVRTVGLTNRDNYFEVLDKNTCVYAKVYHKEAFLYFNNEQVRFKKESLILNGFIYKKTR